MPARHRGLPDPEQWTVPHGGRYSDLHEGAETQKQNRGSIRFLRLERGGGQTDQSELEAMKFDIIDPGLKIQYVPDREGLKSCYEYGKTIGQAVAEACG